MSDGLDIDYAGIEKRMLALMADVPPMKPGSLRHIYGGFKSFPTHHPYIDYEGDDWFPVDEPDVVDMLADILSPENQWKTRMTTSRAEEIVDNLIESFDASGFVVIDSISPLASSPE